MHCFVAALLRPLLFVVLGGGGLWHFKFAWEISRFKLTMKFPTRNSGFSAKFSYTGGAHSGLWQGVIHSTRGLCKISHSEIYHRKFNLARKFPLSCMSFVALVAQNYLRVVLSSRRGWL